MQKIRSIEFLRILLLICILIFHVFQKQHLGILFPDMSYHSQFGDKAVEMFFIISGFLLMYTYRDKVVQNGIIIAEDYGHTPGLL